MLPRAVRLVRCGGADVVWEQLDERYLDARTVNLPSRTAAETEWETYEPAVYAPVPVPRVVALDAHRAKIRRAGHDRVEESAASPQHDAIEE